MKKVVTYAVMLAYLTVTIRPIQAQYPYQPTVLMSSGLPKVVVYVSERRGYSSAEESALRTATLNTLVRSGRYDVIERSNVIDAELMKQASGAVDDDQLTAFGRQSGAQYICMVEMVFIRDRQEKVNVDNNRYRYIHYKDYQVSVRMIDVETAEVLGFGLVEQSIVTGPEMTAAVTAAVDKMLATVQSAKAANMPKMAVYVVGAKAKQREGNALYSYTLGTLFMKSKYMGDFKVIERSEAFTKQIDREQITQRSGHVDDNQIAQLGKQYGIERIWVVSVDYAMNTYTISSRIVNVETANVERASKVYLIESNMEGLWKKSVAMVDEVMGVNSAEMAAIAEEKAKRKAEIKQQVLITLIAAPIIIGIFVLIGMDNKKNKQSK